MALQALGFDDASMVRYGPAEMAAQVDAELQSISPLAHFGSELDLIRAHRALALQGCSFLVVAAPSDALRQKFPSSSTPSSPPQRNTMGNCSSKT